MEIRSIYQNRVSTIAIASKFNKQSWKDGATHLRFPDLYRLVQVASLSHLLLRQYISFPPGIFSRVYWENGVVEAKIIWRDGVVFVCRIVIVRMAENWCDFSQEASLNRYLLLYAYCNLYHTLASRCSEKWSKI